MKKAGIAQNRNANEKLTYELFESLNNRDLEEFMSFFTDEASFIFPGTNTLGGFYLGKKKIKRFLDKLFLIIPDMHFKIINTITQEKLIAAEWMSTGITRKGLPYESRGVSIIEMHNGTIKEMRQYYDTEKLRNP
ncbi:MAG: nuclear transport factor 2 family protein [Candidatus Xenobiia bacterium LiM19]